MYVGASDWKRQKEHKVYSITISIGLKQSNEEEKAIISTACCLSKGPCYVIDFWWEKLCGKEIGNRDYNCMIHIRSHYVFPAKGEINSNLQDRY